MILRRYITSQVALTTALVLGFLVVVLLGGRLIRYFGIAAEGGLNTGVLWTLIGYNLPYFLELILPLSFFIGLMLVFGRMHAEHEMAVLNAGGVSRGALSRLLLPLVVVVFVIQLFITVIAKPWGVAKATNLWQEQSVVEVFDLIRTKEFISSGNYHLYVGEVGDEREFLKDVIIIQMNSSSDASQPKDDPQNPINKDIVIFAKLATQVPTTSSDGSVVLDLHDGRRYEIDTTSQQYSQVGFGRYRIHLTGKQGNDRPIKIEGVATRELMVLNDGVPTSASFNTNQVRAELGYRLALPFLIVIAVLLATPLATTRPRQGRWLKLIPAIFVFVANVLILISLKETISKGKMGLFVYPLAVVIFMMFALYLNYHEHLMTKARLTRTKGDKT